MSIVTSRVARPSHTCFAIREFVGSSCGCSARRITLHPSTHRPATLSVIQNSYSSPRLPQVVIHPDRIRRLIRILSRSLSSLLTLYSLVLWCVPTVYTRISLGLYLWICIPISFYSSGSRYSLSPRHASFRHASRHVLYTIVALTLEPPANRVTRLFFPRILSLLIL